MTEAHEHCTYCEYFKVEDCHSSAPDRATTELFCTRCRAFAETCKEDYQCWHCAGTDFVFPCYYCKFYKVENCPLSRSPGAKLRRSTHRTCKRCTACAEKYDDDYKCWHCDGMEWMSWGVPWMQCIDTDDVTSELL